MMWKILRPLHWRHNEHNSVSNHQPHDCLPNRLFRRRSKKTSQLRVTGLFYIKQGTIPVFCYREDPGYISRLSFHRRRQRDRSQFETFWNWLSDGFKLPQTHINPLRAPLLLLSTKVQSGCYIRFVGALQREIIRFSAGVCIILLDEATVFNLGKEIITYWSRNEMAAILQIKFSSPFSWMRIVVFWLQFHWNLFCRLTSSTGLDTGLAPNMRRAIIWTSIGLVCEGVICNMRHSVVMNWHLSPHFVVASMCWWVLGTSK